eukprot:scaffold78309_cov69-Phaeocystis_antarctica.AAC.1
MGGPSFIAGQSHPEQSQPTVVRWEQFKAWLAQTESQSLSTTAHASLGAERTPRVSQDNMSTSTDRRVNPTASS